MLRWGTGVSGAEASLPTTLTVSLNTPVLAPTALLAPPVHPVLLAPSLVAWALHGQLHRSWITGASDASRLDRCGITGVSGATELCRTRPFLHFFEFFVFCFTWPFYIIPGIYKCSLDKLISPIDCVVIQSTKSQNNGLIGSFSLQRRD